MRTSIYMLFVWIMVVGVAGSVAGQTSTPLMMSFEEAYQMMEQNNPGLLRMKEQVKQKKFEQKAKRGLHLPTVSLNAEAVTMSDPLHLDLTPVRDAIVPLYNTLGTYGVFSGVPNPDPATNQVLPVLPDNMSTAAVRDKLLEAGQEIQAGDWDRMIQEKNFASVSAGFVWPIYVGSKIQGANEAAGVNLGISKEEVRVEQGALLTELVQRYYGLELGLQVVKVREQMLQSMDNHYQDAKKMFDNGIIAKVELLHAQVARNEADREYKQAVRNLDIIRSGLAATLANDSLENLTPSSHLFINKELDGLSGWISKAKQENPMLKKHQGKKELGNIQNKVEKRDYLPSVAAMGNYNLVDKNLSPYMPDWLVGVGMKWTLFEGMSRNNKIHASETLHNQVEFAEQKAHSDLEAYLTKLYQELHMQMEQKTELETTLELASEYAESTEKAFNEGFATSTSVVEAYTKVAQVKALRLKVLYDYDVVLARFLQATGTPEDFTSYCRGENSILES